MTYSVFPTFQSTTVVTHTHQCSMIERMRSKCMPNVKHNFMYAYHFCFEYVFFLTGLIFWNNLTVLMWISIFCFIQQDISGHFNKLFLCTHRRLGTADGVVLRAFGPNMNKYVDHTAELTCMQIMRDFCGGAAVLARFENGIAYTYIDGKCFDIEMMTSVHYGRYGMVLSAQPTLCMAISTVRGPFY